MNNRQAKKLLKRLGNDYRLYKSYFVYRHDYEWLLSGVHVESKTDWHEVSWMVFPLFCANSSFLHVSYKQHPRAFSVEKADICELLDRTTAFIEEQCDDIVERQCLEWFSDTQSPDIPRYWNGMLSERAPNVYVDVALASAILGDMERCIDLLDRYSRLKYKMHEPFNSIALELRKTAINQPDELVPKLRARADDAIKRFGL